MFRVAKLAACAAVVLSGVGAAAQVVSPPEATISVNGTGRVERTPDYVEVSLGVDVLDPVASKAQGSAEKAMGGGRGGGKGRWWAGWELRRETVELRPQ